MPPVSQGTLRSSKMHSLYLVTPCSLRDLTPAHGQLTVKAKAGACGVTRGVVLTLGMGNTRPGQAWAVRSGRTALVAFKPSVQDKWWALGTQLPVLALKRFSPTCTCVGAALFKSWLQLGARQQLWLGVGSWEPVWYLLCFIPLLPQHCPTQVSCLQEAALGMHGKHWAAATRCPAQPRMDEVGKAGRAALP